MRVEDVSEAGRTIERFYPAVRGTGNGEQVPTKLVPQIPDSPVTRVPAAKAVELSPRIPDSPLPVTNATKAATLYELIDWRNQNSVSFAWSEEHSSYWVIPQDEHKLSPEIAAAIREQQDFAKAISSSVPEIVRQCDSGVAEAVAEKPLSEMTDDEFFDDIRASLSCFKPKN